MSKQRQSFWTIGAALLAAVTVTTAPATAQGPSDPIGFSVTSALEGQKGIGRILSAAGSGDVAATARDIERLIGKQRWARLVSGDPEVLVTIQNRERTEKRRSTDKNGNVSIEHRYRADGWLDIGGRRSQVRAEVDFTEGQYSTRNDADQFEKVAEKLWEEISGIVLSDINVLRPGRAEAGFEHVAKYKLLVKGDGLEVRSVEPGSPAEQAGLQVKDRIRRIDTEKGTSQMDYRVRTWWVERAGTRVSLEYERDKARQTVELTLAPRSEWGGAAPVAAEPAPAAAPARAARPAPAARPMSAAASAPARSSSGGGSSGVELKPGMTEAEVAKLLGAPREKVAFGAKSLWRYDGYSITFQNGRVVDMK